MTEYGCCASHTICKDALGANGPDEGLDVRGESEWHRVEQGNLTGIIDAYTQGIRRESHHS